MSHKKLNSGKTISIKLKTRKYIRFGRQRHGKRHRNHATSAIDYDLFSGIKHSSNFQVVLEMYFLAFQFYFWSNRLKQVFVQMNGIYQMIIIEEKQKCIRD